MATDFCRAMLCISAAYAVMRCLSVRPSVCLSICVSFTFVDHVKRNKHVVEFFSRSGSHTILVFPYQTGWQYFDGTPLTGGGASNAGGVGRNHDSESISGFSMCCERCNKPGVVNSRWWSTASVPLVVTHPW